MIRSHGVSRALALTKLFAEFVKNLTPDQVQVAVGGVLGTAAQASELRDVELDCDKLNDMMRLDRLRFTSVTISWLKLDFQYFQLKHKPMEMKLGTVSVELEECKDMVELPPPVTPAKLLPYSKFKHALDSMSVDAQHVLVHLRILPHLSSTPGPQEIFIDIEGLRVRRCDSEWRIHEVDLEKIWLANAAMTRKQGRVFVYRQLTCESARCWLEQPRENSTPLVVHICEFHGPELLCRLKLFRYAATSKIGSLSLMSSCSDFA